MVRQLLGTLAALALGLFSTQALANSYAEDRALIENMSNRHMIAVDAGDIDTVMDTWADDGELYWVGGVERGREAIRKAMSNFGGGAVMGTIPADATERPRTRHQIINHVITVNGDTATSFAYWFAMTNKTTHGQIEILYMGHYEDELVRVGDVWKFKKRVVYNESRDNRELFYPGLSERDPRQGT